MKWHTVPNQGNLEEDQSGRAFKNLGALSSITREPPQNSRDNVRNADAPVEIKYRLVDNVFDSEQIARYFPETGWLDHVSLPAVKKKLGVEDEILPALEGGFKSVIIEDYNATGLEGDVRLIMPDTDPITDEITDEFMNTKNTWFWFMRSKGVERPSNRGGSWGLGKMAFPLASKIRTFFVVTTREDGSRYLAGQSILCVRSRHGAWYDPPLFFAAKDLHDDAKALSWLPIEDDELINQFCDDFGVVRPMDEPGTSIVIVMPKEELLHEGKLIVSLLANYLRPVSEGKMTLKIGDWPAFSKDSLRAGMKNLGATAWDSVKKNLDGSNHGNPGKTTEPQANELMLLSQSLSAGVKNDEFDLVLETPGSGAPSIDAVMPEKQSEVVKSVSSRFHANECVLVRGELPIITQKGEEGVGAYTIALRKHKPETADEARSYCYRDHIYVAHAYGTTKTHKSQTPGVSSLLVVEGKENPLAGLLRAAEGPAHLAWTEIDK